MVTTTNLQGYWKLDDNAANTTVSDSHNSNDGTASVNTSTLSSTGKINESFSFTGTQYCSNSSFTTQTDMSFSFWVYSTNFATGSWATHLHFGETDTTSDRGMQFGTNKTTGLAQFLIWGGGTNLTLASSSALTNNNWHHIVGTKNGNDYKLYVNGTLEASGTITMNTLTDPDMWIAGLDTNSELFTGKVDEIGYWDRTLSSTDVSDLYNSGDGLAYPFASDVTISPSTLTLSSTQQAPSYFIDITAGAVGITSNLLSPVLSLPVNISISSLSMTSNLNSIAIQKGDINRGTYKNGTGTRGTKYISEKYPVTSGLEIDNKHDGRIMNLVPDSSNVPGRDKVGL